MALKIARKLKIPCFLVTHAPFLDKKLRNWQLNLAVFLYDNLIGKRILNKYDKIIAITQWEIPYLLNLGARKEKICYIPNGIPDEFFSKIKKGEGILFFGRIAPVKDIETLIRAIALTNEKLTLIGPIEEPYGLQLINLIRKLKLNSRVEFKPVIYDLKNKIQAIDKYDIFVLPSKREGMPQALIEAMARGKLVISSKTEGGKEIIKDRENGFLFDISNEKQLAEIISNIKKMPEKERDKIRKEAKNSVKQFAWGRIIIKIEELINNSDNSAKT